MKYSRLYADGWKAAFLTLSGNAFKVFHYVVSQDGPTSYTDMFIHTGLSSAEVMVAVDECIGELFLIQDIDQTLTVNLPGIRHHVDRIGSVLCKILTPFDD